MGGGNTVSLFFVEANNNEEPSDFISRYKNYTGRHFLLHKGNR